MGKKSFINIPVQGLLTDLDKSKMPQDRLSVSENVRFHDDDEGDFVAKPATGNDFAFQLSEGFVFHGKIRHKDISFIFSKNDEGLFEVGSYPSPRQIIGFDSTGKAIINTAITGFEDVYKPLCNFKGKYRLRTDLFEFGERHCQGVAKIIYDNTYNLYYTDRKNPLRGINSGFDDSGVVVDTHDIGAGYFENNINLIQSTARSINVISRDIINGGELDYATYYLYLRYATKNLNVSDVVIEIGPFMINKGTNDDIYSFASNNTYLSNEKSKKAIQIQLGNIDTSYEYIEVLFTRFTSDENGELFYENKLINKKYPASTSSIITINGTEELISVIPEEIINEYPVDDKANYIHTHNNMLFGCDWIRQTQHSPYIKRFASKVAPEFYLNLQETISEHQYSSNEETDFSYFPEEIYPFAIKAVLNNGTVTFPYPIRGVDFYDDVAGNTLNEKGLVRFPSVEDISSVSTVNERNMLGVKFLFSYALDHITDDDKDWINKNVKGFIVVQGDRIKNRIAEGIGARIVGNELYGYGVGDADDNGNPLPIFLNNVSIPILNDNFDENSQGKATCDIPDMFSDKLIGTDGNTVYDWTKFFTRQFVQTDFERDVVAIYSSEIMLNKVNAPENVGFCKRRDIEGFADAKVSGNVFEHESFLPTGLRRNIKYLNNSWERITVEDEEYIGDVVNHTPFDPSPKFRCINQTFDYFTEPNNKDHFVSKYYSMYYRTSLEKDDEDRDKYERTSNRNMATPKYLALKYPNVKEGYFILYKRDPASIIVNDIAEPENIVYYEKSDMILLESLSDDVVYKGDAFIGNFSFKQMSWDPSNTKIWDTVVDNHIAVGVDVGFGCRYESVSGDEKSGPRYAHGIMIDFSCYSEKNLGYRIEDDTKSFYPLCKPLFGNNIDRWYAGPRSTYYTFNRNRQSNTTLESFLYNRGSNQLHSIRGAYGFNDIFDYQGSDVRAKARIRFSIDSVAGEITDSWRIFMANAYRDFDRRNGTMIGLATVFGKLLSLQENSLNQHYVNEKQVQIPSTAGEIVIGKGDVLSDRFTIIADYGIQSDLSFTDIYEKLVGYDKRRNIAWIIGVNREQYQSRLNAHDITESGLVKSTFSKAIALSSDDILVSTNNDAKNILFSSYENQKSVVYDYARNIISTVRTNAFKASVSILEDFYTAFNGNVFFKENDSNRLLNYYGVDHDFKLGVVVNGLGKENNLSKIDKIFESVAIESTEMQFTKVEFRTRNQNSILLPFVSEVEFWRNPVYDLSKWIIPVPLQKSNNAIIQQGAEMMGTWMEVIITNESAEDFYVKSLETIFNLEL